MSIKKETKKAVKAPAKKKTTSVKKNTAVKKSVKPSTVSKKTGKKITTKKGRTISATKKVLEVKKISSKSKFSFKRTLYMSLSILLGLVLGMFVNLFIELVYMRNALSQVTDYPIYYFLGIPSLLPSYVLPSFLLAGLAFGVWLGIWGWKFVYIDRLHRKTRLA